MKYILNHPDDGILKIELNRPQKRNALTLDTYTQFAGLLKTAQPLLQEYVIVSLVCDC